MFSCCLRPAARCRKEPVDVISARRPQRQAPRFCPWSVFSCSLPTTLYILFEFECARRPPPTALWHARQQHLWKVPCLLQDPQRQHKRSYQEMKGQRGTDIETLKETKKPIRRCFPTLNLLKPLLDNLPHV